MTALMVWLTGMQVSLMDRVMMSGVHMTDQFQTLFICACLRLAALQESAQLPTGLAISALTEFPGAFLWGSRACSDTQGLWTLLHISYDFLGSQTALRLQTHDVALPGRSNACICASVSHGQTAGAGGMQTWL